MTKINREPVGPQESRAALPAQAGEGVGAAPAVAVGSAFLIVGLGASAGGLAAFEGFFGGLPAAHDPGMAFVLVQHLAPDHKSLLGDLIRRCTRMQVFEVEDGMAVQINCAYIIPPGRDMAFLNGCLHLLEPLEARGHRMPIDYFFRSLASDQRARAIGIVLSGMGHDGTLGLQLIKAEGGMTLAQDPASAEFDGMPRSAIAAGVVDCELPPAAMAARLMAYAAHSIGKRTGHPEVAPPLPGNAMQKIFILLRAQTGHDFSRYKPSTIHRRIDRRMGVQQIDSLATYVRYLQQSPSEVAALFRDLLIGVTQFFRDAEVFQMLEARVIPRLFEDKPPGAVLRVWTAGCSTGEEAYSLAILLVERMEALKQSFAVQVFATDIDSQAIGVARRGCYPASIAADLTPERLARFFTAEAEGGGYRIHKNIRDLLVFSVQDVIKDPPFSKLDLISCRNLLIYLQKDLQQRLIPLFHYALKPGGLLLLGTSEGVGKSEALFGVLDRKSKLYERMDDAHGPQPPLYLVNLEEAPDEAREAEAPASAGSDDSTLTAEERMVALTHELRAKDEYLEPVPDAPIADWTKICGTKKVGMGGKKDSHARNSVSMISLSHNNPTPNRGKHNLPTRPSSSTSLRLRSFGLPRAACRV